MMSHGHASQCKTHTYKHAALWFIQYLQRSLMIHSVANRHASRWYMEIDTAEHNVNPQHFCL